jgi:hypothetical protein
MEDDAYVRLVREIEIEKGRVAAHEQVCAERYGSINATLGEMKRDIKKITEAVASAPQALDKRTLSIAAAIMMLMISVIAWEGSQLYQIQPILAAAHH